MPQPCLMLPNGLAPSGALPAQRSASSASPPAAAARPPSPGPSRSG
jgi:hypothetical protein